MLPLQIGWPNTVMKAFAADINRFVEPLDGRSDIGGWTPTNSVATSNHLGGTAMDLAWNNHPFHVQGTYSPQQQVTIRELLDFYEGNIYWGGDWTDPIDEMHYQMGYNTFNNPAVADFINRKITGQYPNFFSTFRQGAPVPAPAVDAAQVLADAMKNGVSLDRYRQLLPAVQQALRDISAVGNINRTAMFMAQVGEESGGLKWMEEIADGSEYEGRADLGNTQPGDGPRFKGRGPIQITGRNNYTQLSQWAFDKGLVPSPTFFVDDPAALSNDQYGFLGPTWYWTVARPNLNALADNGDVQGATQAVNGGLNGLADRQARWDNAIAMGPTLLEITYSGGFLMALSDQQQQEVYDKLMAYPAVPEIAGKWQSRARYATNPGQGVDDTVGMILYTDANVYDLYVEFAAVQGHKPSQDAVKARAKAHPDDERAVFFASKFPAA